MMVLLLTIKHRSHSMVSSGVLITGRFQSALSSRAYMIRSRSTSSPEVCSSSRSQSALRSWTFRQTSVNVELLACTQEIHSCEFTRKITSKSDFFNRYHQPNPLAKGPNLDHSSHQIYQPPSSTFRIPSSYHQFKQDLMTSVAAIKALIFATVASSTRRAFLILKYRSTCASRLSESFATEAART